MALTIDQIVRIAAAGGGMTLNSNGKTVDQVVRIAAAASRKHAKLVIRNTQGYTVDQLVRIAAAGDGCVFFDTEY
jgi:DNA replication protein